MSKQQKDENKKGGESEARFDRLREPGLRPLPVDSRNADQVVRVMKYGLRHCHVIDNSTRQELEGWIASVEEQLNIDTGIEEEEQPDKDEIPASALTGDYVHHFPLPGSTALAPPPDEPSFPPPPHKPITPEEAGSAEGAAAQNAERDQTFNPAPVIG